MDIETLEARALEFMKRGDFGDEAVRINAAIVAAAPKADRAWSRLGRCYLEQRRFDDAIDALRTALSINPTATVAANLLNEVRKQRALTPNAVERASTGFTAREFAVLETSGPAEACRALEPRLDMLFDAVNASPAAQRIADTRTRQGAPLSKLFRAGSCHGGSPGHMYAFHHGGRREPQWNLGWFAPPFMEPAMRIGVGFDTSAAGRDPDRAGQEQALRYFESFQRVLSQTWKGELARWMGANGGFIQYASGPPSTALDPVRGVDWLIGCRNAPALEWIFVGRWLLLQRTDDAAVLRDRAKLARVVDEVFRALLPIWIATYAPVS